MSDLFNYLEKSERERDDNVSGNRARIVANQRVQQRFAKYIGKAEDETERKARVQFLADEIAKTVKTACKENGYANHRAVIAEVVASFKTACKACGCSKETCDKGDCPCEDCPTCGKGKESSLHTAAPVMVDNYQSETVNLKGSDEGTDGHGTGPATDHGRVPDGGLDPIDVKSVRHPLVNQNISEGPDYSNLRHDGPEVADPTDDALRKQVNADTPIQDEFNRGPHTDTWNGNGGQADAVTSSVESKWSVEK